MGAAALALVAMTIGYFAGVTFDEPKVAQAAGGKVKSPVGTAPDRYVYYPGTEALGKDWTPAQIPYWDGHAGERIADILLRDLG